jgi:hypothetical protein
MRKREDETRAVKGAKTCPKCHKPCMGIYLREIPMKHGDKVYRYSYYYAAHYRDRTRQHTPKWCYIGRTMSRDEKGKAGADRHDAK